jgi:SAM-dependent methyltransferase
MPTRKKLKPKRKSRNSTAQHLEEISDFIAAFDHDTLARLPVHKRDVVEHFVTSGNRSAARIVSALPERDGILEPQAVDQLLVRVHCELQRLSEEFQHGQRVAELLRPFLTAIREIDSPKLIRVIDIGCGTGYVLRWLAANEKLGDDVELLGVDFNSALIEEAQRLAQREQLRVKFLQANAFRLEEAASIILSTGVLHHFRGQQLASFFSGHERANTKAFIHFDFQPSPFSHIGSWLFHAARFSEPLAKHDGVVSALRAHDSETLVDAAKAGAPGFLAAIYSRRLWFLPIPRSFHALVGLRSTYREAFLRALNKRAGRLAEWR